jgi:acetylornithine deacetylase/succinyl-diaminopimelate desuccinylase-like protein
MPRRMAHALHALLEAEREHKMPVTAREVCVYDEEASGPLGTGAALREARKRGHATFTGRYWVASFPTYELRYDLERRYLRETEQL